MKKIISFSLAILMAFNQLPVSVLADNNGNQEIDRNPVVGFQAVRPFEEGRHPRRVAFRPLLAREGEEQFDGLNDRPLKALAVDDQKFRMQGEDFDDALALFSPDYAAAAIVKSVTAEDLQKLLRLPLEVGIAVIRGSIVMFTSGSANELRGNQAVKDLLAEASIMIHTHHEGSRSMPSALDFQEAGEQIEYAITMNGVYAYNHHGLVQQSPLTAGELIALIERVHAPNTSSYAARRVLNRFIVAVQDMNVHPEAAQVLRSADPLTVLPRAPIQIGTTGQASGGTAISFNTYHADYNLTNAPGWGGIFISWDDPATGYDATRTFNPANPPIDPATGLPAVRIIETIDLSSFLTNPNSPPLNLLSVNSNSTPNCVPVCRAYKIDFYDDRMVLVAGQWVRHKVSYYPPAYGDLVLTRGILAQLQSTLGLNLNRIQEIVIVAEAANTNPDIGYMNVTLGNNINYVRPVTGVAFNPATQMNLLDQWQQRPSLGLGTVGMTDIPGVTTEDKDGIFNVTQSNDRQFQIQYAMPDTEDFGFVSLGGYFNRQNQFVGAPQNFDGTYTIALSGPAGSSLNLEMTNTAGEKYISQLIMTGSTQLYTIALDAASVPPGFLSNSKQIANVVLSVNKDKSTGASCGTSSASLCTVNVYTRDMYYMPPLTLVPTATLTNFGGQATFSVVEPCTVRGENPCATNHIVNTVTSTPLNSASQYSFVYDLRNGNATDDPGTRWAAATLESNTVIDLTVPGSSIVMDVNSTTGHFFIEVQDTVNSLHVIKVEGRNGRFVITRASLLTALATETPTDFDFSRIRRFTFVADNANDTTGTITVSGLGLRYAQEVNGTTFNDAPGVLANFNQFFPNLGEFVNTPLAGQTPHSSVDLATPTVGTQFQLNFSVPNAGDFAGASLAGGAFDTTAIDPREIQIGFTDDLSGLTLSAQGQAGLLYNLEYSTHLAHWELAQLNMRADANGRLFAVDDGHLVTPTGILSSPFAIGNSSRTYRFRLAPNQPGTFVPAPSGGFRNLGNPFSLGIDGPAGQQLTVEVFSKDGRHQDFIVNLAGVARNYVFNLLSTFINPAEIAMINFVAKNGTATSGTVRVYANGMPYTVQVSGQTTGTITNLSAFNVRPGILNPTSGVIAEPYADNFRQVDDKTLNFDYAAVAEDFGGAIYVLGSDSNPDVGDDRFDTFYNMAANGDLVFKVSGVNSINVSISDDQLVKFVNGKPQYRSVTLNFTNLGTNPYIVIKHSDLVLAAAGFGVNLTSVSFVINDQTVPASGTLSIESAGLVNIPDISARPTGCTTAAVGCITDLSDYKIEPGILNRVSGVVTRLAPTLGQETNAIDVAYTAIVEEFGGAIFVLGKNTEEDAKLDTFYPLNGDPDRLVFKVSGVTSIHVSVSDDQFVRFIDGKPQYRSVTLNFTGISAANPYVVITRADLLLAAGDFGVNLTSVSFVIDDQTVPSSGMVRIESLGLLPPPEVIPPDSTLRASDISTFPFLSWNIFDNDGPGSRVTGFLNPTSATQGKFIFNVSEDESFAGTVSSFDDPSTPSTIESASLSGNLTLGVSFDSLVTGQVQVEVEDTAGHRAKVLLDNVTDQEQFYRIALTRFLGVDLAHIKQVVLVVINGKVSDNTSALFVRLGNHPTIPGRLPNPTLTAANISQLPGIYGVIGGNGNINVINNTRFNLNFDVSAPGARAYSVSHTNNFGTTDIEFRDWSSSFPITVGLRLTQGTGTIIAEVQDADNDKAFINLFEVSGTEGFYQINLSDLPSYVDPARIVGINFVVANSNVTSNTGILEVRMGSHGLVNGVTAPVSAFNSANLVTLNGNPLVTSGGGNVGSADPAGRVNRLDVTSAQTFSYAYDIHAGNSSFAFARISNGSFNQSGVFTGTPINLTQNFSIAASGSAGNKVILLLRDTNNLVARYVLTLDTTLHNYAIDLSSTNVPAGFRRDSIGEIVFNHDRDSSYLQDVVNVMIKGVNFTAPVKTPEQQSVYNDLLAQGQAYFTSGNGIDAVSGLPLELINSGTPVRTTQPALIGLYAQILGENVGRQLTAQTRDQALAALNRMMDSLIEMQWSTGWNGLIPTALSLNTNPPTATNNTISLGENALLAQSLAVTMGSILLAQAAGGFTAAQTTQANNALNKINDFLEEQQGGYFAMVDNTVGSSSQGLFYTSVTDGVFSSTHIDHLATQYRGAIAFLLVRYPLARTVWDKLTVSYQTYVDRSGAYINNLALENGAASEMFGPLLRNSELDHIGFFSALQNHWLSQQDFAYQNNLMGFLSGVDLPGHPSQGQIGLPGAAWQDNDLIVNMGSPAAIAAGCQINFSACLNWMVQINTIAGMQAGPYGFFENARSQSEITTISRGTSIAATVLGLSGQSGAAFDAYLSSWGYAKRFNDLYDAASQRLTTIFTSTSLVAPIPEFPATSRTVFEHVVTAASGGSLVPTSVGTTPRSVVGYEFKFNALAGGTGNYQWVMDQSYDAQNNSFLIHYSTTDTPKSVVFQFRDAAGNILFSQTAILESTGGELRMLRLALPDQASLQSVRAVEMVVNQASDDNARADFIIRDMVFQKVSVVEPQGTIAPNPNKTVTDISDFPGSLTRLNKVGDHSSLRQASPFEYHLDYNLATGDPQPDTVAGINIDLCGEVDYVCTRSDGTNLSGMSSLVFGVQSQLSKLKQLTFQIVDMDGNIAIFDIAPVNAGVLADGLLKPNYYEFLMSRATEAGVDLTRIRRINFLIDDTSFTNPADRVGQLRLQIRI